MFAITNLANVMLGFSSPTHNKPNKQIIPRKQGKLPIGYIFTFTWISKVVETVIRERRSSHNIKDNHGHKENLCKFEGAKQSSPRKLQQFHHNLHPSQPSKMPTKSLTQHSPFSSGMWSPLDQTSMSPLTSCSRVALFTLPLISVNYWGLTCNSALSRENKTLPSVQLSLYFVNNSLPKGKLRRACLI